MMLKRLFWVGVLVGLSSWLTVIAPARAADLFVIRDVPVDVTAKTAARARVLAHAQGRAEAFRRLIERLTLEEDREKLPELGDETLAEIVSDFGVDNEKTSRVRYLAKLNVRFKADEIRRLFRDHGVRIAETVSKPILMLPIFEAGGGMRLWEEDNTWRNAWNLRRAHRGLVELALPLGDLSDRAALDAAQASSGDVQRLTALSSRYSAGDSVVALAQVGRVSGTSFRRLDISTTRYSSHSDPVADQLVLTQKDGESLEGLLVRAADQVAANLEEAWKRENLLNSTIKGITAVTVPIGGLKDWLKVKGSLEKVSLVRRLEVILMSLDEIRINLHYVGAPEQLQIALGQADLALIREEDEWVLYPVGGVPPGKS